MRFLSTKKEDRLNKQSQKEEQDKEKENTVK